VSAANLHVRSIRAVPVMVPLTYVLGTSAGAVHSAPLLLLDLITEEGITGRAYQFCYTPAAAPALIALLDDMLAAICGDSVAPVDLWAKLTRRYTLIGVQGIVRMGMSLLDVAAWDALSRAAGVPLATFLGAKPRPIHAYNSNGLGLMAPGPLADEAARLVEGGFRAVKLRLGYATLEKDLAGVDAVRQRIPESVAIMVDYNQALTVPEAIVRGRALDKAGVYWIEEPVRHDDYDGCAEIKRRVKTPVQIGENFSLGYAMKRAIDADSCSYVMPDLERIGGVTGWQRASGLAHAAGLPMSSHLYPEVSAHLLAATPTAHWLEYVDWINAVVTEPLRIVNGMAQPSERPGNGLEWNEEAVQRLEST
jgi:mandelate racemase